MNQEKIILKTIEYIEMNLEQELSLDDIAGEINYSKFHLSRLFSDKVGCTIYKYIQMRRLTEAARKLVLTTIPVIDIAFEANYNSQQAFTFAFKRNYQLTPQLYRTTGVFIPKQNPYLMLRKQAYHSKTLNTVKHHNTVIRCGRLAA